MTVTETLTALMDKARQITGLTEKISIPRLIGLMDHFDLHVNPNLLSQTLLVSHVDTNYPMWSNTTAYCTNRAPLEPGKTYTLSWCARTDGNNRKIRVRIFNWSTNTTIPAMSSGIEFPLSSTRQSYTFTIPNGDTGYNVVLYGSAASEAQNKDVTFYDVKLEYGDLATPLQKVGGVVKALLCALTPVRGCAA